MNVDFTELGGLANADFGEAATFTPFGAPSFGITGIFIEAYREVSIGNDGQSFTTEAPVLGVNLSDFPSLPLQDDNVTITRTGETFVVKEVRPDSHGWALLMLNALA